ncbi:MAG TPA: hypothetical protein VGO59_04170 [Verrucomicrobiae bacterium]
MPTKQSQRDERRPRSSGDPTQFQNEDEAWGLHRDDGAQQDQPGANRTPQERGKTPARRAHTSHRR